MFPARRYHGLHSLRGALAVAMLQADTPPPVVTAVLGHAAATQPPRTISGSTLSTCAAAPWTSKTSSTPGKEHVRERGDAGRPDRHADRGPPRRRVPVQLPERVLRQFAGHCRREGYADGSIVKEAVEEFLYGRHLKASTIRREEIVLRDLAEHARQFGWQASWAPPALTAVKKPHRPPPYVFSDEEIRRLFRVIDTQPLSGKSNRALVDPVLFRAFYGAGLRLSEALNLELRDSTRPGRPSRYATGKTTRTASCPSPGAWPPRERLYRGRPPLPEPGHKLFHTGDPSRPADKSTVYNRFRRYLADADIPHFPGGPHIHSLRHGFAVANLRRWAADAADLVVMLPYLSAYMGHADLRGTQYYLQLTADAHPEVAAMASGQVRLCHPGPGRAGQGARQ